MARDVTGDIIRNLILLQRIGNGISADAGAHVQLLIDDIIAQMARIDPTAPKADRWRRERVQKLLDDIEGIAGEAYQEIFKTVRQSLAELGKQQALWAADTMRASLGTVGADIRPGRMGVNLTKAIIDRDPMQGELLRDWVQTAKDATVRNVRRQIQLGMLQNETLDQLIRRVRGRSAGGGRFIGGVMEGSKRDIAAIVRTGVNDIANTAHMTTWQENQDILRGYQIVATLDARTTPICRALDGQVFKFDDPDRKQPPFHFGCRTVTVPVVDWEGLGIEPPPEGTRASATGQVPASMRYEDWLKNQSKDVQDDILGPRRAELFREGKVTLRDLVTTDGRVVRLDELRVKVGEPEVYMGAPRGKLAGFFTPEELEAARRLPAPPGVPEHLDPIEIKAARVRQANYPASWKDTSKINTPEREALREQWAAAHREELIAKYGQPAREKQAIFVIGPPAAGKTSVVADPLAVHFRAVAPDSDGIKRLIPEFDSGLNAKGVHVESAQILTDRVLRDIIKNGENFVYQGIGKTLDGPDGLLAVMEHLKKRGYTIHVYLNELAPLETAQRAVGRYLSSGRLVPPDYILSVGTQPTASFERLKKSPLVSSWARYANDQPRGQPPRLIERSPNSVDVRDPKLRARAAALEEAAERFEKLTTSLRTTEQALLDQQRFEVAHIIDRDGKHVARVTSNAPDYVRFDDDQIALMKGKVLTHNHPITGGGLSSADVLMAIRGDLQEIRAVDVVRRQYVYRLIRPPEGWVAKWQRDTGRRVGAAVTRDDLETIHRLIYRAEQQVYQQLRPLVDAGRMSVADAEYEHWHRVMEIVARELGLIYRRERVIWQ